MKKQNLYSKIVIYKNTATELTMQLYVNLYSKVVIYKGIEYLTYSMIKNALIIDKLIIPTFRF